MSVRIAAHAITAAALGAVPATAGAFDGGPAIERARVQATPEAVQALALEYGLGIDHGSGPNGAVVLAPPGAIDAIAARGVAVQRLPDPPPATGYRMPDVGVAQLADLSVVAPRAGLVVLGYSVENRPLTALWLGQPPESGAPAHRILGAHHGDEYSSFEVALAAAQALAESDGADPQITALLDVATVWIVPYCNPDGVVAGQRWNAHGVDINRNYGYEWSAAEFLPGPRPFSEPETRAIRAWAQWVQPVLGLSLHSGAANFGWVWNYSTAPAEDASALEVQGERYAAHTTAANFWVTNGADWYRTWGDTNDWSYGRFGVWDSTVELTEIKAPPADQIGEFTADHLPAVLDYISVLPDLSAQVVDADSGLGVDAEIALFGASGPKGRPFRTEPGTGWFHHLVDSDPVQVRVRAPGYREVQADPTQTRIALTPDGLDRRVLLPAPAIDKPLLPDPINGQVTLSQPGHPDLTVLVTGGVVQVSASAIGGGAWTVVRPDGTVHRNALMVSDAVRTQVDAVTRTPQAATLSGTGFAVGARAWALYGEGRARAPLPVTSIAADQLVVDLDSLASVTGRIDLWIVNAGEHLFVADLDGNDPQTWDTPTGLPRLEGRACACSVKTGHLPAHAASWILTLLLLLFRRTS